MTNYMSNRKAMAVFLIIGWIKIRILLFEKSYFPKTNARSKNKIKS